MGVITLQGAIELHCTGLFSFKKTQTYLNPQPGNDGFKQISNLKKNMNKNLNQTTGNNDNWSSVCICFYHNWQRFLSITTKHPSLFIFKPIDIFVLTTSGRVQTRGPCLCRNCHLYEAWDSRQLVMLAVLLSGNTTNDRPLLQVIYSIGIISIIYNVSETVYSIM